MALETEIGYYNELLPELLKLGEGQLAVIEGRDLIGIFPDTDSAYCVALAKYGVTQFLMRPIRAKQDVVDMKNLHFGLISVHKS